MNHARRLAPLQSGSLIAFLVIGGFVTAMAVACGEPEPWRVVRLTHPGPAFYHPRTLKPWSGNSTAPAA